MGYSAPNPINISDTFALVDHLLLDRDEAMFFIQGLDETFIEEVMRKREQESKRKTPRPTRRR